MKIDVYTATGTKKGQKELPATLFNTEVNEGLMHQALVMQQSNRRSAISHTKSKGDIQGSTKKLFQQKGTGRARRGSKKSPVLRGGNKAFGPQSVRNYHKDMPKNMRRGALRSCLTAKAQEKGVILGLEGYSETIKTKDLSVLLGKLPVSVGRKIVFVVPETNTPLHLSGRNIPGVKTIVVNYLNPEDVLGAWHLVFVGDSIDKAAELFGKEESKDSKDSSESPKKSSKKATTTSV